MSQPKFILILLVLFSIFHGEINAQTSSTKYLSTYQSALGSNTSVIDGIDGISGNPATLYKESIDFSLMVHSEQRFFLQSLNSTTIAATKKIGDYDHLGISFGSFGINEYNEKKFLISYSRMLSPKIKIGSSTNYYLIDIEEYGTSNYFDINFGVLVDLNKTLNMGLALFNILPQNNEYYQNENTNVVLGIKYALSPKLKWLVELGSNLNNNVRFSTGVDYKVLDDLQFIIGMNTLDNGISLGLKYSFSNKLTIIGATRSTQNLGMSPGFGLTYQN